MKTSFKSLPEEDKPRERLKKYGSSSLSNEELLAIILKTGTKDTSVDEVARNLLIEIKNINKIKDITLNKLTSIKGIGEVKAISILAVIELGKRIYLNNSDIKKYNINNPLDIVNYYKDVFKDKDQEEFHVLYLDTKNNIISKKKLFIGTLNKSIVHPREIFKDAYLNSASGIVCIHNHPSGNVDPSKEDVYITKNIHEISKIHGITLIDHLIISSDNYFSFFENNYIKHWLKLLK